MKKFSIITFIIICASALFDISNIHAQEQFVVDGIKYQTLTDSTVQVIANGYTQDTIEIPSKVTNYELEFTVTKIGDKAFSYHT